MKPLSIISILIFSLHTWHAAHGQSMPDKSLVDWSMLLAKTDLLLKELEIVKPQQDELKAELSDASKEFDLQYKKLEKKYWGVDDDLWRFEAAKLERQLPDRHFDCFNKVFLPHQIERLMQVALWATINDRTIGFSKFLLSKEISQKLNLSTEQSKELANVAAELQKEFDREVLELQRTYLKKVAEKTLDDSQNSKLNELYRNKPKLVDSAFRF